jgi:hypothetical protein
MPLGSTGKGLSTSGGTVTGDVTINGRLTVEGSDPNHQVLRVWGATGQLAELIAAKTTRTGLDVFNLFNLGGLGLSSQDASGNSILYIGAENLGAVANAIEVVRTSGADVLVTTSDGKIGAFGQTPVAQPTGVAVTAAGIHAALVSLGLITA